VWPSSPRQRYLSTNILLHSADTLRSVSFTMCLLRNIIVSVSLRIFILWTLNSRGANRRPEHPTQSSQMTARRRREAAAKRQSHTNTTEQTAHHPKCSCIAWRIFLRAHTCALSQNNTCAHTHTHTYTHTHTHSYTRISALFAKAETLESSTQHISDSHRQTSRIKTGMHSRHSFSEKGSKWHW